MMFSERRYDIDWLRVIAIGLLLIYHIAIGFQPWGVFIGFIQNTEPLESVWVPMSMLNVWRIPLLFFVSGMGVWFAIQRRDFKQLLLERSKRILLPFVFGMAAIVPLHVFIWQDYYHQEISYDFNPAHLWFLGNLSIYVVILAPLFYYLKRDGGNKFQHWLNKVLSNPFGLLILVVPFIIEAELVSPESFELYAMTLHGFIYGLIAFLLGFCCVYSGMTFWNTVTKWRWVLFSTATIIYLVRVMIFDLRTPDVMMSIESCMWIFAVFGFGHKHLNRPGKVLTYLSKAVYPIYIVHMFFLYLGSALLFTLDMPVWAKFILLNGFTVISSLLCYEFLIRRISLLRPLFGLKLKPGVSASNLEPVKITVIK